MALVPNCPPDLRIYKSNFDRGLFTRREQSEDRSRLLRKIQDSYRKALVRLNLRVRPGMAARFLHGGGFCLGFLDPVSNILANTLIAYGPAISAGECDLVYLPEEKLRDLERRSLDGLVTFLTRFFPYLPDCHAVRFLLLADADLMVAVRIVALDLGIMRIGSDLPAFNDALAMAFKCGAMAAKHPNPDRLFCDWLAISSRLLETMLLLDEVRRRSPSSSLYNLAKLLDEPPPPVHSCLFGALLDAESRHRSVPFLHSSALKGTLQDAIHGFYLQAIARLPAGELRSRLHRSLLIAGHCYGPFDPVSNIIINTIWYDAAFPPTVKLEVDVIGTMILHRMENCSLYGLVSFLSTRHHLIDFNQAIRILLEADGHLLLADHLLDAETTDDFQWDGLEKAYLAAAMAAYHPNPDAQAKLLHLRPSQQISMLLEGSGQLSSEDVQCLARLLCPEAACNEQTLRPFPHPEYLSSHTRMYQKINAALSAYAATRSGEPTYELHTICGVNKYVSGPVGTDAKCYHTHVNFLATPKGTQFPTGTTPLLFFAEVSNGDDEDITGTRPFVCRVSVPLPCAGDCIQHAFVKQMQITKRAKGILQKKDPNSIPNMSTPDLKSKYEQRVGKVQQDAVTEVVHTALAVKEEGIDSEDSKMVYKACNVSVVRRTEYTQITAYLARGFPLHAGVYVGRTLSGLRFCRKYKPPRLGDFRNAKRTRISCHAILLVGAGRKKGKWYFFFLNTWRRFCLRFDSSGKIITHGIGKVVAGRLYRNLIRLSRFKEESSEMSLQPQDGIEISEHNRQLIAIDQ